MTSSPASLPSFIRGVHYERHGSGRWKWVLLKPLLLHFDGKITKHREGLRCSDGDGRLWLAINPDALAIPAGYSWNGSSCSPDLPGVMLASCVHDALYQFCGCPNWPSYLDRQWADSVFYNLSTSRLRLLYALGLALGSWAAWGRASCDGSRVDKLFIMGRDTFL